GAGGGAVASGGGCWPPRAARRPAGSATGARTRSSGSLQKSPGAWGGMISAERRIQNAEQQAHPVFRILRSAFLRRLKLRMLPVEMERSLVPSRRRLAAAEQGALDRKRPIGVAWVRQLERAAVAQG